MSWPAPGWSYVLRVTCCLCGTVAEHDHGPDIPSRTRDLPAGWTYIGSSQVYVCPGESCTGALADYRQQQAEQAAGYREVCRDVYGPAQDELERWRAEHPPPVPPWRTE